VDANERHIRALLAPEARQPRYVLGDGRRAGELLRGEQYDMIFMCPPCAPPNAMLASACYCC